MIRRGDLDVRCLEDDETPVSSDLSLDTRSLKLKALRGDFERIDRGFTCMDEDDVDSVVLFKELLLCRLDLDLSFSPLLSSDK